MSIGRRRRLKNRNKTANVSPHTEFLLKLLADYFGFLEQKEKPSDEEVREKFIAYDQRWVEYCNDNQFDPRASLLFNQEVARAWRSRYTRKENKTEN